MLLAERTTGLLCLSAALAMTLGFGGYVLSTWQPDQTLDADSCPLLPVAATFAVIDKTDEWSAVEQERISQGIIASAERRQKGERFSLHVLTDHAEDTAQPWKGFQRCKAHDPRTVNPVYQNERLERAEFEAHFLNPLMPLVPELAKGKSAPQSPILAALEILMWSPNFRGDVPRRRLEIWSDLLQHDAMFSQLSSRAPDLCAVLASDIGKRLVRHDWRGIVVVLHYLRNPRDARFQGAEHLRFWSSLFYQLGVAEVREGDIPLARSTRTCEAAPAPQLKPATSTNHKKSRKA